MVRSGEIYHFIFIFIFIFIAAVLVFDVLAVDIKTAAIAAIQAVRVLYPILDRIRDSTQFAPNDPLQTRHAPFCLCC